jgi:2-oxoglutarate dehydrogenase E2 component (dihydrolipoamide succinyltransferase)
MSTELRAPQLPESVADATIIAWHKQPGDRVAQGETLVDLETDKVVLEVPAPADGVLGEIRTQVGEVVTAEAVLGMLLPPGAGQAAATAQQTQKAARPSVQMAAGLAASTQASAESPTSQVRPLEPLLAPAARRLVGLSWTPGRSR